MTQPQNFVPVSFAGLDRHPLTLFLNSRLLVQLHSHPLGLKELFAINPLRSLRYLKFHLQKLGALVHSFLLQTSLIA